MYYKEKLIDGVWYFKTMPDGEWRVKNRAGAAEMTTTPDAVDALHYALLHSSSVDDFSTGAPAEVIKHLNDQGFTITRTEPEGIRHSAVADYLKDDKGLRPAMSEAELLLHCQSLAMEFADDNLRKDCEQAAFELAKKYRR